MKILNATKDTVIAQKADFADSFLSRMVGLLKYKTLAFDEALIITHCQSIHMFFMRFPIDVIFVSKDHTVVGLVPAIKPFYLSPIFFRADYAIEIPVGVITRSKTAVGDRISLNP